MRKTILFLILTVPLFVAAQPQPAKPGAPQKFKLPASPKTVAWGYYDSAATPVLRIHSGDTVVFDTLITNSPTGLERPASRGPGGAEPARCLQGSNQ